MIRIEDESSLRPFRCQVHCLHNSQKGDRLNAAPINICWANTEKQEPPAEEVFRYFEYYSFSHMYDGSGFFTTPNGSRIPLHAGQGVLIAPGFIHYYGSNPETFFAEDNICFYGSMPDYLFQHHFLTSGIMEIGSVRVLQPIIKQVENAAELDRIEAGIRLMQLLIELSRGSSPEKSVANELEHFNALLQTINSSPGMWWSIAEMCHYANLSASRLRTLFKEQTGFLPKQYLDHIKINQARELLHSCDWSLGQIAKHLGYEDVYHFSRRFKALVGVSPNQFRQA